MGKKEGKMAERDGGEQNSTVAKLRVCVTCESGVMGARMGERPEL